MFCPTCGKQLHRWHLCCPHCHEPLPETIYARQAGGIDNGNATTTIGESATNVPIHIGNID